MDRSARGLTRIVASILLLLSIVIATSIAHAGAKCPNRYFKKEEAKSIGETEQKARDGYPDAVAGAINKHKNDCDNCECEEDATEVCTFQHTELKKPKCHPKAGKENDWRCIGWIRPGCFCMDKDEGL